MKRLTEKAWRNLDPWECCGQDKYCKRDCHEDGGCAKGCVVPKLYDKLAAYEDTGLEPEQVKDAIRIAERIATANYPHDFQHERSDITDYMRWITDVMRDAKAWWNGRIKTSEEAEKAMEVSHE